MSNEQLQLFGSHGDEIVADLPKRVNSKAGIEAREQVPMSHVLEVFNFWRDTFFHSRPNSVKLTTKRHQRIASAIKEYGIATCVQAIRGCSMSDWHMGNNPQGQRYVDVALIFRSHEHVERFVELANNKNDAAAAFLAEQ